MNNFTYIELFSGVGGFRQALDKLGGECVFASEIDPFATKSYRALYDGAPELHGDITKINAENIPDHDVLVGGFPCQSFSVAGQRRGFEEARGTLFFEIARIAKVKRPRLMLLENVKGLLSHDKGKTFEVMCGVLDELGYAIDFKILNSKHYGVPQNRERIFIVASRDAYDREWVIEGKGVEAKRSAQDMFIRTFNFDWPTSDKVTTRLRDVLETNVDEKYYLSEEKTAKLIAHLNEKHRDILSEPDALITDDGPSHRYDVQLRITPPIRANGGGRTPGVWVKDSPIVAGSLEHYGNDQMNRVYHVDGVAATIIAEPQIQQFSDGSGISYNVDANYAKGTSPGDIGKGRRTHVLEPCTVIQKTHSASTTVKYDETGTLHAARLDKVPQVVTPRYRIRKLTPLECWRLQGFSDAAHETVKLAGVSDSQRYKQAGNAVTVNVIKAIGERLMKLL